MKFEATDELVKLLGKKWAGKYEIRVISALDYIAIGDEYFSENKPVSRAKLNYGLLLKSVFHNGKPLEKDVPPKLMEMLLPDVIKVNAFTLEEERELFLRSSTENPKMKAAPDKSTTTR